MAFRSHLGRPLDMSLLSNRVIVAMTVIAALAAGVLVATGRETTILLAPPYTFALWALGRELDPDHDGSALLAGLIGGIWVLVGLDPSGFVLTAGLAVAGRLTLSSTGRRPLRTDLIVVVIAAGLVSFSRTGWVAGFAIAIGIYVDDRMDAEAQRPVGVAAATVAALATAAVASLASVVPQRVPAVTPEIVVPIGLLALFAFAREPGAPTSLVDSRRDGLVSGKRLHATRGLAGAALFGAAILAGPDAAALAPPAIGLALAMSSDVLAPLRASRS